MNIEEVRAFALGICPEVTEELFADEWISWRIGGKWFLLMQLDAPEPRVAVKLPPDTGLELRDRYSGVRPAYHMNKTHWNDLYLNELSDDFVKEQITASYKLVRSKLPKKDFGKTKKKQKLMKPKIQIELVDKKGLCNCHRGHKIGDIWDFDTQGDEICPMAMHVLFPYIDIIRYGGTLPRMTDNSICVCCPDADVINIFKITKVE